MIKLHQIKGQNYNPDIDAHGKLTFSQHGEDIVVSTFFYHYYERHPNEPKGCFVDIGAYHPVRFSNTYLLYLLGWRGVNIDPNPTAIELCKAQRPEDVSIQAAISDSEKELFYIMHEEGAYNQLSDMSKDDIMKMPVYSPIREIVTVQTETINALLEENLTNPNIDVLNVDTEGLEKPILYSLDFKKYRPKILCLELDLSDIQGEPLCSFFAQKNYRLYSQSVHTAIMVDELLS